MEEAARRGQLYNQALYNTVSLHCTTCTETVQYGMVLQECTRKVQSNR